METKDFLTQENYMLRREIEKLTDKLEIYETILFQIMNAKLKFELDEYDTVSEPHIIIHVRVPEMTWEFRHPLVKVKDLMSTILMKNSLEK